MNNMESFWIITWEILYLMYRSRHCFPGEIGKTHKCLISRDFGVIASRNFGFNIDGINGFEFTFWGTFFCLCQAFDYVELFAGRGWVTDTMASSGCAVAKLDILFHDPKQNKQNFMDLTTDSGFWPPGFIVFVDWGKS